MPQLQRSVAALRIGGDGLVPEEISKMMGSAPSRAHREGEKFGGSDGLRNERKSGQWSLEATDREPENFDRQINEILSKLTDDLAVWARVRASYEVDLFCGWFMGSSDEGIDVSPENLKALGDRGIKLSICMYAPSKG
ncbi:DUF4279 domain-containing protein [Dongia sp.]|uniref:DUF4279 domain-containing protein n=1 Tax=Dongia sp. TaxID=1977262 RepID=UPI0035B38216